MVTLEDLASKGKTNYSRKISIMHDNYAAAKDKAIRGYEATPFGPTRKAHYRDAWSVMPDNYRSKVTPDAADKWYRNWIDAMSK